MSASETKWDGEELILPGFRFHPTDEELVDFYLRRKVGNKQLSIEHELIKQIDIYKYEPWELPSTSVGANDQEWYFFCLRGRKYKNSVRPNRVTGSGFWKATGIDKPIYSFKVPHDDCIGLKKSLVYYRGSAGKGSKTDWMMHEFRLPPQPRHSTGPPTNLPTTKNNNSTLEAEVWTLCRIFKRRTSQRKYIPAGQQLKSDFSSSLANSDSKTCSDESNENYNKNKNSVANQTPIGQQNLYRRQQLSSSPLKSNSSVDRRETWSYTLNDRGDAVYYSPGEGGDWDELRPVVDPYGVVDNLSHSR